MLSVYNTLSRRKEVFQPLTAGHVRMYVCGMTTYDFCHLGHARMLTAFDVIYRWLLEIGYSVQYVRNITDIDDKIIQRAALLNEEVETLTARYIEAMHADTAAMGLLSPTVEPRATQHIPEMLQLIERLITQQRAYQGANGDVYFAVRECSNYGKLSGKFLDQLQAGQRVAADRYKKDPLDFVLWKAAKEGEPSWPSRWGAGRPGWHIECSAMSHRHLGQPFDIHGGGEDLQFPHHENEIAQSESAYGCLYANYWLHNGFIQAGGEKMSKSLGNFQTIREALQYVDGEVLRFFMVRAHYRSPILFSQAVLQDAKQGLTRLYTALRGINARAADRIDWSLPAAQRFKAAMDDDFNTAEAVAVLFDMVHALNKTQDLKQAALLVQLGNILGLLKQSPDVFLKNSTAVTSLRPEAIDQRVAERQWARQLRDFKRGDEIRDGLLAEGILIEDRPDGTSWWRRL